MKNGAKAVQLTRPAAAELLERPLDNAAYFRWKARGSDQGPGTHDRFAFADLVNQSALLLFARRHNENRPLTEDDVERHKLYGYDTTASKTDTCLLCQQGFRPRYAALIDANPKEVLGRKTRPGDLLPDLANPGKPLFCGNYLKLERGQPGEGELFAAPFCQECISVPRNSDVMPDGKLVQRTSRLPAMTRGACLVSIERELEERKRLAARAEAAKSPPLDKGRRLAEILGRGPSSADTKSGN